MLSGYTYTHKRLQTVPDTSSMTIRNKYCRKKKYSQEALLVVFRTTLETQMNGWRNAFCLFFPPVLSCSLRTSSCSLTRSLTVSSSPSLPPIPLLAPSLAPTLSPVTFICPYSMCLSFTSPFSPPIIPARRLLCQQ